MAKKLSIRKPQLRITSKGVRITKPSARVGGAAGVNLSSKGASASVRTKHGSVSTHKGCRARIFPVLILFVFAGVILIALARTTAAAPTSAPTATRRATARTTAHGAPRPSATVSGTLTVTATPTLTVTTVTTRTLTPTPVACPKGCRASSPQCLIKGNISKAKEKIYHLPKGRSYTQTEIDPTAGERWFCTEDEAKANGFRRAK